MSYESRYIRMEQSREGVPLRLSKFWSAGYTAWGQYQDLAMSILRGALSQRKTPSRKYPDLVRILTMAGEEICRWSVADESLDSPWLSNFSR
jgi:hypothetical protein